MMWYALGYEMNNVGEGDTNTDSEDAIMLEEKSRNMWLEKLERRECAFISRAWLVRLDNTYAGHRFRFFSTFSSFPCLDRVLRYLRLRYP